MSLQAITPDRPLVLVGAGKMGRAMLVGWLANGLDASAVIVVDPAPPEETKDILDAVGISAMKAVPEAVKARVVLLAIKPQTIKAALPTQTSLIDEGTLVISIAAGTALETLISGLGTECVVRAMPNTPAQIGKGMTALVAANGVDADRRGLATELLSAVGAVEWIEDEALIDAVTGVSGSGPAYVFLFAECLAEAGVEAGLDLDLARRLADATVSGAGALLEASDEPVEVLRANVTSPGGTTAAALKVLSEGGLADLVTRAVEAAKKRAKELA